MVFLPPSAASNNVAATTDKEEDLERMPSVSPDTVQSNTEWAVEGDYVHAKWEAMVGTSEERDGHENKWGEKQRGLSTDSHCKGNLQKCCCTSGCLA